MSLQSHAPAEPSRAPSLLHRLREQLVLRLLVWDVELLEFHLGLTAVVLGGFLMLPVKGLLQQSPSFHFFLSIAPMWVWVMVTFGLGLAQIGGLLVADRAIAIDSESSWQKSYRYRKLACNVVCAFWALLIGLALVSGAPVGPVSMFAGVVAWSQLVAMTRLSLQNATTTFREKRRHRRHLLPVVVPAAGTVVVPEALP
jgi:hypothetical protein